MDIATLKTDSNNETNGVWIRYDADTEFQIASPNGSRFKNLLRRKSEELRRKNPRPSPAETENLTLECYAEAILVGWRGLKENEKEVQYSVADSIRYMRECPTLRDFVYLTANDNANFKIAAVNEAKTNVGES